MSNTTSIFTIASAPKYVFTILTVNQYLKSGLLPISGQEPQYTVIPINASYLGQTITQQASVDNISTYLYSPLIQNLTYQYQYNQSLNGTPVNCYSICDWNGSLVYSIYQYPYQYANPNFGYLELPKLNQTLYYNTEIAIIADTPLRNDSNMYNNTYGKLCLVTGQYTCAYGLTASQTFQYAKNYSTFVIYGEGPNATFVVNGYTITGWTKLETYLSNVAKTDKVVTISYLNSQGATKWTVSGILENTLVADIIIAPNNFQIFPGAYPPANPLTYNTLYLIAFFVIIISVGTISYAIAAVRFKGEDDDD
jgi:hypothetical protein